MLNIRSHLKKIFWPNLGVGSGFQPDQLKLILVVGLVMLAITAWRYFRLHFS